MIFCVLKTLQRQSLRFRNSRSKGVSASMVVGSMTISANHNSVENVGGTAAKDRSGYALGLHLHSN
jgi:hypothetical protein